MKKLTLLYTVALLSTAALCAYLVADYLNYRKRRITASIQVGEQASLRVAQALDSLLSSVSSRAITYARQVAEIGTTQELLESIRSESLSMPVLMGVTVAFEPSVFDGKARYAPFFNKIQDRFQFIENSYDYTSVDLETANWYTGVVQTGESKWSDPYWAEAAEAMVVDYGVPLFGGRGELIGVVDYTITLSHFTNIVDSLSVGESGYGFTFDQQGSILTHPNPKYLLTNVFELRDRKDPTVIESLKTETRGVVQYNSTYTYKFSWFFFRALESTGWKSVLVFAEDDLLGSSDEQRRKLIHIFIGVSTLLKLVLLFLLRLHRYNLPKLWTMVAASSFIISANIVFILYLNVITDFSKLSTDQERIVNKSILANYTERFDRDLQLQSQARFTQIPTGLVVESYELAAFEASVIGVLWMKYPKDLLAMTPPAFYFPAVSALEPRGLVAEKIGEVEMADHVLVTWKFRVTLEQDFSYEQFPFEQNDIEIIVLHPDFSRNILLVPDLDSYDILNPSVRPGLNPEISEPSSEILSSFFTFKMFEHRTNFGTGADVRSYPALRFTIVVKRVFLSPFIANLIPIMSVALIMFIVLYVSSGKFEERLGLNIMNLVQSSAGFLFILLLSHVNERNRIETPEIAYIELFYFSMYVFITFQAVALACLVKGIRWRILEYKDNLIFKLMFWPALLTIWFAATLWRFY